ncbi:MAG: HAMP domain-containing histidine kinase, partial [Deltaproteobacteria bacterium]|nr:HAMP domain-containing histidine kinase [Deltaproteobacteria bacterium]
KDDIFVSTDIGQLQQVVLNIIDNAIDATGKGGIVNVSTAKEGMYGVIRVRDNGPGIPPDRLHQIFDPFFTTKRPGEGTGLGLSICYSIMEGLGGDVSAANHPSGGAEFTIRLPASNSTDGGM